MAGPTTWQLGSNVIHPTGKGKLAEDSLACLRSLLYLTLAFRTWSPSSDMPGIHTYSHGGKCYKVRGYKLLASQ